MTLSLYLVVINLKERTWEGSEASTWNSNIQTPEWGGQSGWESGSREDGNWPSFFPGGCSLQLTFNCSFPPGPEWLIAPKATAKSSHQLSLKNLAACKKLMAKDEDLFNLWGVDTTSLRNPDLGLAFHYLHYIASFCVCPRHVLKDLSLKKLYYYLRTSVVWD